MPLPPRICKLIFGRNSSPFGIGQHRPSLSWRYELDDDSEPNWKQSAYEVILARANGKETKHYVDSADNVEVAWPDDDISSREIIQVKLRAKGGQSGEWTDWYNETVEAALLEKSDWSASVIAPDIAPPVSQCKRPFYVRKSFHLASTLSNIRIYATALGVYELSVNGKTIGDHIQAPGWQSYNHRIHFQTYVVPPEVLQEGDNVIQAVVAEGWYSGKLTWLEGCRNLWGAEPGVMIQLEQDGKVVAATSSDWEWAYGPLLQSELYDGETYDVSLEGPENWRGTKLISLPAKTSLIAPEAPPIRRTQEVAPQALITSPSGKKILDFGQNLVGWVKIAKLPKRVRRTDSVLIRYAEVLDNGELGVRPLRTAKVTDRIFLDENKTVKDWEPKFSTHGFRYCELNGVDGLLDNYTNNFTAVVVHSDMERIGDFECSHSLLNQLHRNVVWGLRGNFVGLPTDCPQRDERLGWTGDLAAFGPTAAFLYDTEGFLANWLHDLSEEQIKDNQGVVPLVVPDTLKSEDMPPFPQAVWGDVCTLTPHDLYEAYGSKKILEEMWESISTWLDKGIPRGDNGLWLNPRNGFQLSDWLDPRAPPDDPGASMTDQYLVADAYLVGIARIAAKVASTLGFEDEAERYAAEHSRLRKAFQAEYVAPSGRLSSDTQTAYTLAYQFDLLDETHLAGAAERLIRLVTKGEFRIATGFAGTPGVLHALSKAGHLQVAYRMLQEKGCPSWLYPITMGATTIWERWDSLLPDGSINPGEMTSFNHYALGAVANFMHTTIGGLRPLEPGYRKFLVQPRPGGTVKQAKVHKITPYGRAEIAWTLEEGKLKVQVLVPANTTAVFKFTEQDETVGSGQYVREVDYNTSESWPPPYFDSMFSSRKARQDTLAV